MTFEILRLKLNKSESVLQLINTLPLKLLKSYFNNFLIIKSFQRNFIFFVHFKGIVKREKIFILCDLTKSEKGIYSFEVVLDLFEAEFELTHVLSFNIDIVWLFICLVLECVNIAIRNWKEIFLFIFDDLYFFRKEFDL